ncbi:MAG TPA: hypothetical protein VFO11_06720 [Candidatus Polarisedimenticolaceae bacterium]|nr:hypothetical protein [Candidatus Polarisedimenticolaceae bacterium]
MNVRYREAAAPAGMEDAVSCLTVQVASPKGKEAAMEWRWTRVRGEG